MTSKIILIPVAALLIAAAGCQTRKNDADHSMKMDHSMMMDHGTTTAWDGVTEAVAVITPTKGNAVSGTIHFTALPNGGGVHIHGKIMGLEPNSTHAFHIHEFGDASASDGMSAGGHFNPDHHMHGAPGSAEHHAGDLGNLTADATGIATIDVTDTEIFLAGPKDPILGRSVVVHAKSDDFSQPVGNAGGRIGVGVIGIAKPPAPPQ